MKYWFILLLTCFAATVPAQDPNYVLIDKSNGLPSNSVYDLLQDSRGFIWMATDAGLCRYDGYSFRLYTNVQQSSRAGSEISEDRFGRIWYESFDGFLFYVEDDSLKSLSTKKPLGYLPYGIASQTVFTISQGNIDLYDLQTLQFRKQVPFNTDLVVYTQQFGNTFGLNTKTECYYFSESGEQKKPFSHPLNSAYLGKLINNGNRELWFYSKSNGNCAVPGDQDIEALFSKPESILQASSYSRGKVWFCTTTGCFAYDSVRKPFDEGRVFFEDKSISCVIEDREHNFWFSTTNEGICFVSNIQSKQYFPELSFRCLLQDGNEILAGTLHNEIYRINPSQNTSTLVFKGRGNHAVELLEKGDNASGYFISSDSFYVVTDKGHQHYNNGMKDMEFIAPGIYAYALSGQCGLYIIPDAPESKWKKFSHFQAQLSGSIPFLNKMIPNVRAKSTCYDSAASCIYFATNLGLYSVTPEKNQEISDAGKSLYISKLSFYKGIVYALTTHDSVITIDRSRTIRSFRQSVLTSISGMHRVNNWLFLYNSNEVAAFNLDEPAASPVHIRTFASDIYALALINNELFFACKEGLLKIPFRSKHDETTSPLFRLNRLFINGKKIPLNDASAHALSSDMNNFSFEYSILSFKTGNDYPLYYRINSGPWQLCSPKSRLLNFSSLAPGDYEISFRLGDASEQRPVSFYHFSIRPPWWKTSWALILFVLVFITASYLLYNRQLRIQQRKNKLATEKLELEKNLNRSILTSIKSQMNPHFFYNALNTIQSFIYANDRQNAGTYLSKFSKLTRMVLEMSEKETISLQEEITVCQLYLELEQARFGDDFHFSIELRGDIQTEQLRLPSMLFQPYIENAIKHGLLHKKGEKKLRLIFERKEKQLIVTIDDNGIGRKRSGELQQQRKDKHRSFSTDANHKRLDLLAQNSGIENTVVCIDKTDQNGLAAGTTVIITIPI